MAYCLPIAVIVIYLMQQTCQATTTVIEPSASIDTATINMDSVTPTETMVAATEAVSMTPSAGAGGANAATSSTNNPMMTTSTQGTISPTPTSAIRSFSSTVAAPEIVGAWESWREDCFPGCCNLKAGWVKKYNATRNCPHHRVCKPDNLGYTSYKEMNCPAKCDKCSSAGMMAKPLSFSLAISMIMAITAYVLA